MIANEVYSGNLPACKGHQMVSGGFSEVWQCKYGGGETYRDHIIHAEFSIGEKVTIFICADRLWVVDIRYSGNHSFWEYCVNHPGMPGYPCCSEKSRNKLEPERLQRILDTKIPNCKFWDLVQARARELCNKK